MFNSQCVASTTCDAITCNNEGTCDDSSGSAVCTCAPGWDGDTCEDVSCTNNPCLHGGTCEVLTGSIVCTCVPGYGGDRCELAPKCTDTAACENGGTCKADTNTGHHICFCAPGFGVDLCTDTSCDINPCENGGACSVENSAIVCTCTSGHGGDRCELSSGAAAISAHLLLLTVVAPLAKLCLN